MTPISYRVSPPALTDFPSLAEAVRMTCSESHRADRQAAALQNLVAARPVDGGRFLEELAAADAGPHGVFRFLLDLEDDYLCAAARVASCIGTAGALAALRFAAGSASAGPCRDECGELAS